MIIAPIVELPFGKGKKWGATASAVGLDPRRLDAVDGDQPAERLPAERPADRQHRHLRRRAAAEHRAGRRPVDPGQLRRPAGLAPITRRATWLNPAAFSAAPAFTFGNAPRTITELRSPGQYNVDGVFMKNFSFGTKTAQLKIEMLNLLNRVRTSVR